MGKTIAVLAVFIVPAFIPRVPFWAKMLFQVVVGLIVYFGFSETMFPLWEGATISDLFGGDGGMGEFNKYAMGVVGTVLGLITTTIMTGVFAIFGKKSED